MSGWVHDMLGAAAFNIYVHPSRTPPMAELEPLWPQHLNATIKWMEHIMRGVRGKVLPAPGQPAWYCSRILAPI